VWRVERVASSIGPYVMGALTIAKGVHYCQSTQCTHPSLFAQFVIKTPQRCRDFVSNDVVQSRTVVRDNRSCQRLSVDGACLSLVTSALPSTADTSQDHDSRAVAACSMPKIHYTRFPVTIRGNYGETANPTCCQLLTDLSFMLRTCYTGKSLTCYGLTMARGNWCSGFWPGGHPKDWWRRTGRQHNNRYTFIHRRSIDDERRNKRQENVSYTQQLYPATTGLTQKKTLSYAQKNRVNYAFCCSLVMARIYTLASKSKSSSSSSSSSSFNFKAHDNKYM